MKMSQAKIPKAAVLRFSPLALIFFFIMSVDRSLWAEDVGVTIQYNNSPAYKGTSPIRGPLADRLGQNNVANSADPAAIKGILSKLHDGDVLALVAHTNPTVFGMGDDTKNWSDFWKTFGISKPPKLGVVLLGGCMDGITKAQSGAIRRDLNTEVLFVTNTEIAPGVAVSNINSFLGGLRQGKSLEEIKLAGHWTLVTDKDGTTTLKELKQDARNNRSVALQEAARDNARSNSRATARESAHGADLHGAAQCPDGK